MAVRWTFAMSADDGTHTIEDARRHFTQRGFADRCEFLSVDFFESVPASVDAYVLKSVIHDWDDERARHLRTCRSAMSPGSRLLCGVVACRGLRLDSQLAGGLGIHLPQIDASVRMKCCAKIFERA